LNQGKHTVYWNDDSEFMPYSIFHSAVTLNVTWSLNFQLKHYHWSAILTAPQLDTSTA